MPWISLYPPLPLLEYTVECCCLYRVSLCDFIPMRRSFFLIYYRQAYVKGHQLSNRLQVGLVSWKNQAKILWVLFQAQVYRIRQIQWQELLHTQLQQLSSHHHNRAVCSLWSLGFTPLWVQKAYRLEILLQPAPSHSCPIHICNLTKFKQRCAQLRKRLNWLYLLGLSAIWWWLVKYSLIHHHQSEAFSRISLRTFDCLEISHHRPAQPNIPSPEDAAYDWNRQRRIYRLDSLELQCY